jgi:hypothetical protein
LGSVAPITEIDNTSNNYRKLKCVNFGWPEMV